MRQKYLTKQLATACILYFSIFFSLSYAQERNIEELVRNSELIIIGKVLKIESKMETDKNIWTYVTIECKQNLKGKYKNEVILRIPGGEVGNLGQYVSGAPKYEIDEEVLSFLGLDINYTYYVNGWEHGKFTHQDGKWLQKNSTYSEKFTETIKNIVKQQDNK